MSSSEMWAGEVFLLHLGGQAAEGVDQLGAATVVEGQGESGSSVGCRGLFGPAHLFLNLGGQLVGAADVLHADVVVHHALEVGLKISLEQAHEEVDLGAGAAEVVFQREGVEGEPGKADTRGGFGNQLHAVGALLVAEEALERAVACPTAIAVHDDSDMLG